MSERFGLTGLVLRMAMRPLRKLFAHWLALVLISSLFAVILLLGQVIGQGAAQGMGRIGADLMIVPKESGIANSAKLFGGVAIGSILPVGVESGIAAMAGVSRVAPQYIFSSAADSCCEMGDILLVGFDPNRDFTVLSWLKPGTGHSVNKDRILAGARVMKAPGATLRFFNHTFTLAARLETSGAAMFDAALFIPMNGVAVMENSSKTGGKPLNVSWGRPSLLLVRLEPAIEPQQMALALERQYPGIRVLTIDKPLHDRMLLLEKLGRCQEPLAATAWFVALLAGGIFLYSSCRTRRASLGLLRSFGYGNGVLAIMFGMEAFVLSLSGAVAGSLTAFFALNLIGPYLAVAAGIPLLPEWISPAASAISWSLPAFPGAMSAEAALIILLMLRSDPADLLRRS